MSSLEPSGAIWSPCELAGGLVSSLELSVLLMLVLVLLALVLAFLILGLVLVTLVLVFLYDFTAQRITDICTGNHRMIKGLHCIGL